MNDPLITKLHAGVAWSGPMKYDIPQTNTTMVEASIEIGRLRDALRNKAEDSLNFQHAADGLANSLDATLTLIDETGCEPEDVGEFEEIVAAANLILNAYRQAHPG